MSNNIVEVKAVFFGTVQGVFFRAHVVSVAKQFKVAGFVRNLLDHNYVELHAVGKKEEIDKFIDKIKEDCPGKIDKVEITLEENVNEYLGFEIRF